MSLQIRLNIGAGVILAGAIACAPQHTRDSSRAACAAVGVRRWHIPQSGERAIRVWIDPTRQDFEGWGPYGRRRLRVVMDEWNSLRLPIRFVEASSARESDIVVDIVRSIPAPDDASGRDQAAATNVTHEQSGAILRARIIVAVEDPLGGRYPLPDQLANLLHEMGHAIGLPHAKETSAVMAVRRTGYELTGADIALARSHYPRCGPRGA